MQAQFINPFLNATSNILSTMCQIEARADTPCLKQDQGTWGVVSGLVGMASETLSGNLILSFDQGSILAIVSKMFMEQVTEINNEVIDAVGEITNMVCGGAKRELSETGHKFSMATPIMISGRGVRISQLHKGPVIQIPFEIPGGKFVVETSLNKGPTP
jgi:chemotaxis protein CheX